MNNPVVKLIVVLAVILGGGWFAVRTWNGKSTESKHQMDLERIRREFLERAPLARMTADAEKYGDEQRALFKWYFSELTEHYNRYPSFKNYERFIDDLQTRKSNKKIKEGEAGQWEERYKEAKALWDLMQAGRYVPVFSALDKSLRFDIYEVKSIPDDKEPRLRLSFVLWGAQRKWAEDSASGTKVRKMSVNASFHELVFKGLDEKDKQIRELRASGDPFKIDNPERLIEEFPPGVVFGYYEIPKIPSEVVKAELSFSISTRSLFTGEEIAGNFVWKMPLEREWKLPPGANWEGAQEQVREDAQP